MHKRLIGWSIASATLMAWVFMAGCGGGGGGTPGVSFNDPSKSPSHNVTTANASFVGMNTGVACSTCHAAIVQEYAQQAHGKDFTNVNGRDLTTGSCAACHVVGFDEPSGENEGGGANLDLINIQCEECHGPASTHMGNTAHINRIPDAKETCWDCHASSYKQFDSPVNPTTDADLEGRTPASVSAHHPSGLMFNGVGGYQYAGSTYRNAAHHAIANSCVTCHLYVAQGGTADHGADALHPDQAACVSCHTNATDLATLQQNTKAEIVRMLIQLGGEDPANPGAPDASAGGGLLAAWATAKGIDISTNDNPTDPAIRAYKAAKYNFSFVLADNSFGVHNYNYARQLLLDSIASLTTTS